MTRRIVTVGTFDGVHRGHLAVFGTLAREGAARGLTPLLISFSNHPLEVVAPGRVPQMLMTAREKSEALRRTGIETVLMTFDRDLCDLTARQWMLRLRDEYAMDCMVVGYDNTFGSDGRGMNRQTFLKMGEGLGIAMIQAEELPGISSSAIRSALAAGDVSAANEMLGYRYTLAGEVMHGRHLGTSIGFPTANVLLPAEKALPATGVYAAMAGIIPGSREYPAVVNIGRRPTVEEDGKIIPEAHIIGYDGGDLYGRQLQLSLVKRIRAEKRFDSLDSLKSAIAADVATAREIGAD